MRLAFDLGLHLDMTPYLESGIISAEECKLRRTIFWAAYLNEQFWGYYLGRPLRSPTAGATVQKPHWDGSQSSAEWKPYGCLKIEIGSMYNPLETICHLWVTLYDLMMPLTDVLWAFSADPGISTHLDTNDLVKVWVFRGFEACPSRINRSHRWTTVRMEEGPPERSWCWLSRRMSAVLTARSHPAVSCMIWTLCLISLAHMDQVCNTTGSWSTAIAVTYQSTTSSLNHHKGLVLPMHARCALSQLLPLSKVQ
jgi:hypothetical protein